MIPFSPQLFDAIVKSGPGANGGLMNQGGASGAGPTEQTKKQPDTGIGSVVNGMFESIFGGDSGGSAVMTPDPFGGFDVEQFIRSSLAQVKGSDDTDLPKIIGSVMGML